MMFSIIDALSRYFELDFARWIVEGRRPMFCITNADVGMDSVWEREKLEARKMLENAAESPASSARFVRRL